jgi:EAL domain-containing protein (putative c-di-GMP-specific phosphodiesterase class I)
VEDAIAKMEALEEIGVHLAIDDFGTGYSSLSALKTFPIARLKIDKTFVNGLPTDDNDNAITGAVIALGRKLHLQVIAEGVETDRQLAFLRAQGCNAIQGFHFRPCGRI